MRLLALLCLATTAWAQSPWQASVTPVATPQPFNFTNAGINFAGTLYLPEHGDRVPAVVVFWGAQGPTRDYALYKQLADGLPAIGVAVLVFDRRGSGESGGTTHSTSMTLPAMALPPCTRFSTIPASIPNASASGA